MDYIVPQCACIEGSVGKTIIFNEFEFDQYSDWKNHAALLTEQVSVVISHVKSKICKWSFEDLFIKRFFMYLGH